MRQRERVGSSREGETQRRHGSIHEIVSQGICKNDCCAHTNRGTHRNVGAIAEIGRIRVVRLPRIFICRVGDCRWGESNCKECKDKCRYKQTTKSVNCPLISPGWIACETSQKGVLSVTPERGGAVEEDYSLEDKFVKKNLHRVTISEFQNLQQALAALAIHVVESLVQPALQLQPCGKGVDPMIRGDALLVHAEAVATLCVHVQFGRFVSGGPLLVQNNAVWGES